MNFCKIYEKDLSLDELKINYEEKKNEFDEEEELKFLEFYFIVNKMFLNLNLQMNRKTILDDIYMETLIYEWETRLLEHHHDDIDIEMKEELKSVMKSIGFLFPKFLNSRTFACLKSILKFYGVDDVLIILMMNQIIFNGTVFGSLFLAFHFVKIVKKLLFGFLKKMYDPNMDDDNFKNMYEKFVIFGKELNDYKLVITDIYPYEIGINIEEEKKYIDDKVVNELNYKDGRLILDKKTMMVFKNSNSIEKFNLIKKI